MRFFTRRQKKSPGSPLPDGDQPAPRTDEAGLRPTFREIFERDARFVWRTLWSQGIPSSQIEDCCQEVFVVVHRRLHEFSGSATRPWLYAICIRVAAEHHRRAHVRHETQSGALRWLPTPAVQVEELEQRETCERLFAVLAELPDDKREAFILHEIEGQPLREIANTLGCPLQTAYSKLVAARKYVLLAFSSEQKGRRSS